MGGTAIEGVDYNLSGVSGQITIPAGQMSATVTLNAVSDHVKERIESATMILRSGLGYKLPKRPRAVLNIVNAP